MSIWYLNKLMKGEGIFYFPLKDKKNYEEITNQELLLCDAVNLGRQIKVERILILLKMILIIFVYLRLIKRVKED